MESRLLTREQCREIDRRAIEKFGIPGVVLMENAGRGCVDVLERLGIDGPVVIFCGKGNNAGDGFVIARHLAVRDHICSVVLLSPPEELTGDAALNFAILRKMQRTMFFELEKRGDTIALNSDWAVSLIADADWVVDAILGTGAQGEPRPPFNTAIDWINGRPQSTRCLAVDVPSGLDCDTGEPARHTVRADHTCTFAAMKIGFVKPAAKSYLGTVHPCDIGLPPALIADICKS